MTDDKRAAPALESRTAQARPARSGVFYVTALDRRLSRQHTRGLETEATPKRREAPVWWPDVTLCHIADGGADAYYCGAPASNVGECGEYYGEAICPNCGNPTCPRCAQLDALLDALDA